MVSMCNETNMTQLLRLLQQWVNIWIMAGASMPWKGVPRKWTLFHGRRNIHQSNLIQQVSESLFMHFVYLLKKIKLRVCHNPSVKLVDIWTDSYWIALLLARFYALPGVHFYALPGAHFYALPAAHFYALPTAHFYTLLATHFYALQPHLNICTRTFTHLRTPTHFHQRTSTHLHERTFTHFQQCTFMHSNLIYIFAPALLCTSSALLCTLTHSYALQIRQLGLSKCTFTHSYALPAHWA